MCRGYKERNVLPCVALQKVRRTFLCTCQKVQPTSESGMHRVMKGAVVRR